MKAKELNAIIALLERGWPVRAIAKKFKRSPETIVAIRNGENTAVFDTSRAVRCPRHGLVHPPCLACRVEAYAQFHPLQPSADEDVGLDLTEADAKRYEKVRAEKLKRGPPKRAQSLSFRALHIIPVRTLRVACPRDCQPANLGEPEVIESWKAVRAKRKRRRA